MASRNINRNVRGQIVSYPLQGEGESYGEVFFIEKEDRTQTKPARYQRVDIENNVDTEIKELSFPIREVNPRQIARTRAYWGSRYYPQDFTAFTTIQNSTIQTGIPWPPYSVNPDGTITPLNYGNPGDMYPPLGSNGQPNSSNADNTNANGGNPDATGGNATNNNSSNNSSGGNYDPFDS